MAPNKYGTAKPNVRRRGALPSRMTLSWPSAQRGSQRQQARNLHAPIRRERSVNDPVAKAQNPLGPTEVRESGRSQ